MPTPDRLTHRSPKPLVILLVAVFAAGTLAPSPLAAPAKSSARAPSRRGPPAATDGQLGPATRMSVRLFERAAGLRVDGVLTPRETRTLKKAVLSGGMAGAVSLRSTRSVTTAASGGASATTQADQPTG